MRQGGGSAQCGMRWGARTESTVRDGSSCLIGIRDLGAEVEVDIDVGTIKELLLNRGAGL